MKRIITFLILVTFVIPYGASAQLADLIGESMSDGQISLKTDPEIPSVFSYTNVSIERNSLLDFSLAQITWIVNDSTIGKSGVGVDTYSIYFNEPDSIKLSVRVQLPDGHVFNASKIITPLLSTKPLAGPNEELGIFRMQEPTQVKIRTNPSNIRAFQRVEFEVRPVHGDDTFADKEIRWYVDGNPASPGLIGDRKFIIRLANPSASTTVSVNVAGSIDSVTFLPRSDPRLRLQTSQAQRSAYCLAQASRMIDSDITRLQNERARIKDKANESIDSVNKDLAFLENTKDYILADLAETAKKMGAMGLKLISSLFSGDFKSTGKDAVALGKYINENTTVARVLYITNQIEYYKRLLDWYKNTENRIEAEIKSAKNQIEYRKTRCLEIASKKPDFSF